MRTFSLTGWSGSGKTTLLTRLIAHFSQQGKRVVAVKRAPHHYHLEPPAKDTAKLLEAGSSQVYLAGQNELLKMRKISHPDEIFTHLQQEITANNCDLLLMEGLHHPNIPMIEVFNSSHNPAPKFPFHELVAIISDKSITDQIPNFNSDDIAAIATFMEVYHE